MATVPRLWEAIYDGFFLALKKMPNTKQKLIKRLLINSSKFKKNLRKFRNLQVDDSSIIEKLKPCF